MAKMNGIELKAIKEFVGMEGYGFSANIYVDGKKVGSVTDAADGGCYYYIYDKRENETMVNNRIKDYYTKNPIVNTLKLFYMSLDEYLKIKDNLPKENPKDMFEMEDMFFSDLLQLTNSEKDYKKANKKGHNILVILDGYHLKETPTPIVQGFTCSEKYKYQKEINDFITKYPNGYATVYKSLDDFNK